MAIKKKKIEKRKEGSQANRSMKVNEILEERKKTKKNIQIRQTHKHFIDKSKEIKKTK